VKVDEVLISARKPAKEAPTEQIPTPLPTKPAVNNEAKKVEVIVKSEVTELQQCKEMRDKFKVIIGESWGELQDVSARKQWQDFACDELLKHDQPTAAIAGRFFSCIHLSEFIRLLCSCSS